MLRSSYTLLVVVLLLLAGVLTQAGTLCAEDAFYVSPDGDDANNGTAQQPFATIHRAQAAVRQKTEAGLKDDIVVYLGGGTYCLEKTLRFGPLDGGNSEHSVTYVAAAGEKVTISGGRAIRGWKRGKGGLWTVTLPDVKAGKWFFRHLYAEGKRLPRGRYPEEGFLKIKSVSRDSKTLQFTEPLPERNFGGQDTEVVVVSNWSISRELIAQSSPAELTAETQIGWVGHSGCMARPGLSAFLENGLSLVTKPGMWYLDRKSGTLYYRPADGEDPNRRPFVAPRLEQLVDIEGTPQHPVRNLAIQGVEFVYANWLIPEIGYDGLQACYYGTTVKEPDCFATHVAIEMDYCDGCRIDKCRIGRIGGSGIGVGAGCRDNRISGCEIYDIGASGVNVGHMKIKNPLQADWPSPRGVPTNNEVVTYDIHDWGLRTRGAHGIFDAMTRDTKIRHNEVARVPYGGIATGYRWDTQRTSQQGCLIEYNDVHEVMLKLNDSGCLYTLGFQPGSIIRGNLLHGVRIGGFAGGSICNNGIFLDEGSKGFLIEDNVIYDLQQQPNARNMPIRFHRSKHEWHIWINNTFQTDAIPPEAAKALAEKAGIEPAYRKLLKGEN